MSQKKETTKESDTRLRPSQTPWRKLHEEKSTSLLLTTQQESRQSWQCSSPLVTLQKTQLAVHSLSALLPMRCNCIVIVIVSIEHHDDEHGSLFTRTLLYLVFVGKLHAAFVLVRESLPVPYTLVYILHVFIMYICICLSEFCEKRMPYMYS